MKEDKEENKIVEEGTIVINEKDIINQEEIKQEETIEVEAAEIIIEEQKENAANEEKQEETKKEELVAKLSVYYDKVLKIDISEGAAIKDIYEEKGVKLTKKRTEELIAAGVAELRKV